MGALWLPVIPDIPLVDFHQRYPMQARGSSWRKWAFDICHDTLMNSYRSKNATYHMLARMVWWDSLSSDVERWVHCCQICSRDRSHPVQPPYRSILADPEHLKTLPCMDVVIDCQWLFIRGRRMETCMSSPILHQTGSSKVEGDAWNLRRLVLAVIPRLHVASPGDSQDNLF